MRKTIKYQRLSIWTLVRLHRDLEEISDKLDHIAFGLDEGRIDFTIFEAAMEQVKRSRFRLENALAERHGHK